MTQPRLAPPRPDPSAATDVWRDVTAAPSPHRRALALIALVLVLSSFVAGPTKPGAPSAVAHWQLGPIYLGRPIVTWGDPPHYLAIVNSIVGDGDVDLRNNYDHAEADGWDVGTRFRGGALDRHMESDTKGRELSYHPHFLPVLLSTVAWPFRGTEWLESVCIWFTIAVTLCGLWLSSRLEGMTPGWLVALALATPLWVYARDVWTEPLQATAWVALLVLQHPAAIAAATIAGVMLKLPFMFVPLGLGAVGFVRGERRQAAVLFGSTVIGTGLAIGLVQYVFHDADHFDLFHLERHLTPWAGGFRTWGKGIPLLLLDPEDGLLPLCPFLVLGFAALRKDPRLWVPALATLLFYGTYGGWRGGSGVSARYLIPMLPVLVLAVSRARPRGLVTGALVAYSAVFAVLAGVLPVAAYDKTPWGMIQFLVERLPLLTR